MMGVLKITHGLPGSGKSTFAHKEMEADPENVIIANRDDIRTQLFGAAYHNGSPNSEKEELVTQVQHKKIQEGLAAGKTVWVDDTNLNVKFLPQIFNLAEGHNVEQFYFNVPVEECIRRNKERGRQGGREVPEHIIRKMAKNTYDEFGNIKKIVRTDDGMVFSVPDETEGSRKIDKYNEILKKNQVEGNAIVFVDVDGTLINNTHFAEAFLTEPAKKGKKKKFKEFFKSVDKAPHNPDVVNLANSMRNNDSLNIVILTGRDDEYAEELINAVDKSGIKAFRVIAKKHGDGRADFYFKEDIINQLKAEGFIPVHSIDDRPQSIQTYKNLGILVSQVEVPKTAFNGTDLKPYPNPPVDTIYGSGACLRCGKPIKNGNIGPVCRTK